MKNIISILTFVFAFVLTQNAIAQDLDKVDQEKNNYIVLTKKVPQLKPIYLAAQAMKAEDGAKYGTFHIVFCGKKIGDLTDEKKLTPYLDMLEKGNVKLIACGFSLKKFGVNPENLPTEIGIVDNGIAYALKLKKMGFFGMEL